jgi:hypothetical protein
MATGMISRSSPVIAGAHDVDFNADRSWFGDNHAPAGEQAEALGDRITLLGGQIPALVYSADSFFRQELKKRPVTRGQRPRVTGPTSAPPVPFGEQ